MNAWLLHVRTAGLVLLVMTAITGLVYPLAITGVAQVLFHEQANGSIVERSNQRVGSSLIGQGFVDQMTGRTLPGYFRGRPSAAGAGYDAASSGGSNLGPTSAVLKERIAADVAIIREENGLGLDVAIPVDLVTASGSGLDPHISRASAEIQVDRVARERGLSEAQVRDLVDAHTQGPLFGLFGEERVNVLELNLALDALAP
jgi:K+-transporting ATPase ATPase C chain